MPQDTELQQQTLSVCSEQWFAIFWKIGKHLKDINESGFGLFFSPAEGKCDEICDCTNVEVNRSK